MKVHIYQGYTYILCGYVEYVVGQVNTAGCYLFTVHVLPWGRAALQTAHCITVLVKLVKLLPFLLKLKWSNSSFHCRLPFSCSWTGWIQWSRSCPTNMTCTLCPMTDWLTWWSRVTEGWPPFLWSLPSNLSHIFEKVRLLPWWRREEAVREPRPGVVRGKNWDLAVQSENRKQEICEFANTTSVCHVCAIVLMVFSFLFTVQLWWEGWM